MTSESIQNLPGNSNNNISDPRKRHRIFTLANYYQSDTFIYYGQVLPVITCIVVVVNTLLIATIIRGKFRTSTYVFLVSIAIAECLADLVPFPFYFYALSLKTEESYLKVTWCYVFDITEMVLPEILHISSLHLTVGLAIERFIVVTFPLKAKRICTFKKGIIFSLSIFAISISSQMDLFTTVHFNPIIIYTDTNDEIHGCVRKAHIRTDSEHIIKIVCLIFLPCIVLLIFTALLASSIRKIKRWRKSNSTGMKKISKALDRLNITVFSISVFVITTEIFVWTSLLLSLVENVRFTKTHDDMVTLGGIILQVSSPINCLILCCLSKKFRRQLKTLVCCGDCKRKNKNGKTSENIQNKNIQINVISENTLL